MKRTDEPHGLKVWFAVLGGVGAWLTHLIAEASFARRACLADEDWVIHAITVVLVLVTLGAMALSATLRVPRLAPAHGDAKAPEPERTELHFLGKLGLLLGVINLLLIVFEGVLVFWVPSCG